MRFYMEKIPDTGIDKIIDSIIQIELSIDELQNYRFININSHTASI